MRFLLWPVLVLTLAPLIWVEGVPSAISASPTAVTGLSVERERAMKPKDTFKECENCPEMVAIPAGSFTMGSPASEAGRYDHEGPQHTVTLAKPLAVGKFSITRGEFADFVADTSYKAEGGCYTRSGSKWELQQGASWRSPGFYQNDRHPVVCISWTDATAYAASLSRKTGKAYRLLSESEYEYAARAGLPTPYPWGSEIGKGHANCDGCGSQWDKKQTAPVGSFTPNAFGLYDMHGNVWQWVEDCYHDSYNRAPTDGSAWTSGECSGRIVRGGSWDDAARDLRSANRGWNTADYRDYDIGFRIGRTLLGP